MFYFSRLLPLSLALRWWAGIHAAQLIQERRAAAQHICCRGEYGFRRLHCRGNRDPFYRYLQLSWKVTIFTSPPHSLSAGQFGTLWKNLVFKTSLPQTKSKAIRHCVFACGHTRFTSFTISHSLSHEFVLTHFHWRCFTQTCLIKSESGLTRSQVTLNR